MNDEEKKKYGLIAGGVILFFLFIMFLFGGKRKPAAGAGAGPVTPPPPPPVEQCPPILPESTTPDNVCRNDGTFQYCAGRGGISKVYVHSTCTASQNLVRKLVNQNEITGDTDPKVMKCCTETCPAKVKAYPSVECGDGETIYQGYCS